VKNIPIYTIGDILPKAMGFFLLPIYTRYLTPADYGIVRSLGAISFILVILFTLAFDRSLFRLYFDYKDEEDKKDLLGTIFITITAFSTILLFILFALQHWIGQIFTSIPFYPYYVYAIFSSYFIGFQSLINVYFQLKQKAALFVFFSIIKTLLIAGLGILYIIVLNEGAEGMLKASMLGSLLVTPIFIFYSLKISNFVFRWDQFKKISLFSLPLVPNLIAVWVMHLSNRIFLERHLVKHITQFIMV
jgi:O-antigen/teichoic acid export membrane protein